MLTKWTVRISSRLYLAVVLPPNTELRRMFSLSFGYQTFGTLTVSEWLSEWVTRPNTIIRFENRTYQYISFIDKKMNLCTLYWIFILWKIRLFSSFPSCQIRAALNQSTLKWNVKNYLEILWEICSEKKLTWRNFYTKNQSSDIL